jgi:hypothetical protein
MPILKGAGKLFDECLAYLCEQSTGAISQYVRQIFDLAPSIKDLQKLAQNAGLI